MPVEPLDLLRVLGPRAAVTLHAWHVLRLGLVVFVKTAERRRRRCVPIGGTESDDPEGQSEIQLGAVPGNHSLREGP